MTLKLFGLYSGVSFSVTVLVALLVCLIPTTIGGLSERDRDRRDRPARPEERPGDERPGRGGGGGRGRPSSRQDRDDHAGQPAGDGVSPGRGGARRGTGGCRPALVACRRDARKAAASSFWRNSSVCGAGPLGNAQRAIHRLFGADADERRGFRRRGRSAKARPTPSRSSPGGDFPSEVEDASTALPPGRDPPRRGGQRRESWGCT